MKDNYTLWAISFILICMNSVVFINGLLFMGALIAGLGPQNLYVLRAGITRSHVGMVVGVCCLGDFLLTVLGVLGLGRALEFAESAIEPARMLAFALLVWYANRALIRVHTARNQQSASSQIDRPIQQALCLTFLNPCVYLDTVLLVGMKANLYGGDDRWSFAAGSIVASFVWYVALGFGTRRMAPFLGTPRGLDFLDTATAVTLFVNAWQVSHSLSVPSSSP